MDYRPTLEDNRFLLVDVLDAPGQLRPALGEDTTDTALWDQVLDEAARFGITTEQISEAVRVATITFAPSFANTVVMPRPIP